MSLDKKFKLIVVSIVVCATFLVVSVLSLSFNQKKLNESFESRYSSYLVADALRQSSADLTRLARTFVATGDKKYEKMYWDVIKMRNGEIPNEEGQKVNLRQKMIELGFSKDELAKLDEAAKNSNELVSIEEKAMGAIKGEVSQTMPIKLMFNDDYHSNVAFIMKPINEFFNLLEHRTNDKAEFHRSLGNTLLITAFLFVILFICAVAFYVYSIRKALAQMTMELNHSVIETEKLINESLKQADELNDLSNSEAAAIQETSAASEEIKTMVSNSIERVKVSTDKTQVNYKIAEEATSVNVELIRAMNLIQEKNQNFIDTIQTSNKSITEVFNSFIGEVTDKTKVINDIVFQTKLLSFNASVEAARAGDHGKGFAVVAEEVGSLATNSGKAAHEINDMVVVRDKEIRDNLDSTSNMVESSIKETVYNVENGISKSNESTNILKRILENSREVNDIANEIFEAAKEQGLGIENINEAMNQLTDINRQNNIKAQTIKDISGRLKSQANKVSTLTRDIRAVVIGNEKKVS
ncbi:methyl-accepting chemotaxis protein [Bacteriovorax sp. BSW11_IV]|uniref:methyl-accepting chemotaxis protein n=1 Tax=Bacteriovorax sp. BSW11_IV TaxID=1353529 RepID=UPI00055900E8|nr:methyl-accepting chemotaxis protein [Bacteriovorax sp. BSW11_IV]